MERKEKVTQWDGPDEPTTTQRGCDVAMTTQSRQRRAGDARQATCYAQGQKRDGGWVEYRSVMGERRCRREAIMLADGLGKASGVQQ